MLYLIKGRAGSGKTRVLHEKITEQLKNNNSKPLLIIPEQFSFETERSMLKLLGPKKYKQLDIFSFSRLAYSFLKNTSLLNKSFADDGVRAALMSEAINSLEGRLNVFSSLNPNFASLTPLVDFCKELKYCRVTGDELNEKTQLLDNGFLKEKLQDIFLINEAYDALLSQSYFDDTQAIDILCDFARENKIFKGKTVYFDGFRAFSKQETECFKIILSQADNVYITLCTEINRTKYSAFEYIHDFEKQLRTVVENGTIVCEENCENNSESFSSDIYQLEKNLFKEKDLSSALTDESVVIAKCVDKYDESKYVASTIKKLIRSAGYRCKDIAVIERSNGSYKDLIIEELKNLDIPVFEDSKRSLKYEALFVYINAVLSCITKGLTTEGIFTYLKSGLCNLSVAEISRLEKYALVWGVGGKLWRDGFTMHPDGFGYELDDVSLSKLDSINETRKKVIGPILKLKKQCEDVTGKEIAQYIFEFLESQKIQDRLYDLYTSLNESGFPVEAQRQAVSWDVLVDLLDKMATFGEGKVMTLSRWYELFSILIESGEIGEIPQGLDEIKIGSADRIRTEKLKVVFLVGVNKEEFPLVSVKSGILTDSERTALTRLGLEIRPPYLKCVSEEKFICYCAVTAASEKLFLSYKTVGSDGSKMFPSEIIDTAINTIDEVKTISTVELNPFELVESDDAAFSLLARNFKENNEVKVTLQEYFKNKEEYVGRLEALNKVAGDRYFKFEDTSVSKSLFKDNMYLSASKIDTYFNCPFSYFMRYGLKAEPLKSAQLDPAQSGSVIHFVMENILQKYPKGNFLSAEDSKLRQDVEVILQKYIEDKMGGTENKTKRFIFLYNRLVETCMAVIDRLKQEFSVGSFEPCGFEVSIGGEDIPPYEVELDSGKVLIKGSIDRVDMMEKDNIKYLRVIDYKTGKKEFKLSELFDGINIQMVLYLMALEKNAKHIYGDFCPSGVLYLPSRIGISEYLKERSPKIEDVLKQKTVSGKLSGMILESLVVLNGMGAIDSPGYFPAGYDSKKQVFTGNTYSPETFRRLSNMVDGKIKEMGNNLHNGLIPAVPCGESDDKVKCKYCDYRSVCGYEYGDEIKYATKASHKDAVESLGGDEYE